MVEEYCSFSVSVTGIKFYSELRELQPFMYVTLRRGLHNLVDSNAVLVITKTGAKLGHVESKIAACLGPLMDRLPQLIIKR